MTGLLSWAFSPAFTCRVRSQLSQSIISKFRMVRAPIYPSLRPRSHRDGRCVSGRGRRYLLSYEVTSSPYLGSCCVGCSEPVPSCLQFLMEKRRISRSLNCCEERNVSPAELIFRFVTETPMRRSSPMYWMDCTMFASICPSQHKPALLDCHHWHCFIPFAIGHV